MQKIGSDRSFQPSDATSAPAEFGDLLLEIEREPVPEKLLELALQLQAQLVDKRKRQLIDGNSSDC